MRRGIAALGFVLVAFAAIPYGCSAVEQPYRYLESYDPSLHGGMWVPDIFPHDIVEIHEQHDLDTNEVWLRFKLQRTPFSPFESGYVALAPIEPSLAPRAPFRLPWQRRWWYENLTEDFRLYQGEHLGSVAYVAIDAEDGHYWWRSGG